MTESGKQKYYIAIDLKSFYASVECMERGLDPLSTYLVVADESRTEKTICLAVSPALKALHISGRARLFEAVQRVKELNHLPQEWKCYGELEELEKRREEPGCPAFSYDDKERKREPRRKIAFITARPQMARYMEYSKKIYQIYLCYVSKEDIHVYSVDEVFIDATEYLNMYHLDVKGFAELLVHRVLRETGITATAGIGTNLYLAKIAMDIMAKHAEADMHGIRMAMLTERSYREQLWTHQPLTDFWRVGRGIMKRLQEQGIFTMGDIARCALGGSRDYYNPELLYRLFGINAELLIDHAFGYEPCTIKDIKGYQPEQNSVSVGQVLQHAYPAEMARIVVQEMTDSLVLKLVEENLETDHISLTVGYDIENTAKEADRESGFHGRTELDRYGRKLPKPAHRSKPLPVRTRSERIIQREMLSLFDEIVDTRLSIRRMYVVFEHILRKPESFAMPERGRGKQVFTGECGEDRAFLEREERLQTAAVRLRQKFGKNAVLRGMSLQEGATQMSRNRQIGGHRA